MALSKKLSSHDLGDALSRVKDVLWTLMHNDVVEVPFMEVFSMMFHVAADHSGPLYECILEVAGMTLAELRDQLYELQTLDDLLSALVESSMNWPRAVHEVFRCCAYLNRTYVTRTLGLNLQTVLEKLFHTCVLQDEKISSVLADCFHSVEQQLSTAQEGEAVAFSDHAQCVFLLCATHSDLARRFPYIFKNTTMTLSPDDFPLGKDKPVTHTGPVWGLHGLSTGGHLLTTPPTVSALLSLPVLTEEAAPALEADDDQSSLRARPQRSPRGNNNNNNSRSPLLFAPPLRVLREQEQEEAEEEEAAPPQPPPPPRHPLPFRLLAPQRTTTTAPQPLLQQHKRMWGDVTREDSDIDPDLPPAKHTRLEASAPSS